MSRMPFDMNMLADLFLKSSGQGFDMRQADQRQKLAQQELDQRAQQADEQQDFQRERAARQDQVTDRAFEHGQTRDQVGDNRWNQTFEQGNSQFNQRMNQDATQFDQTFGLSKSRMEQDASQFDQTFGLRQLSENFDQQAASAPTPQDREQAANIISSMMNSGSNISDDVPALIKRIKSPRLAAALQEAMDSGATASPDALGMWRQGPAPGNEDFKNIVGGLYGSDVDPMDVERLSKMAASMHKYGQDFMPALMGERDQMKMDRAEQQNYTVQLGREAKLMQDDIDRAYDRLDELNGRISDDPESSASKALTKRADSLQKRIDTMEKALSSRYSEYSAAVDSLRPKQKPGGKSGTNPLLMDTPRSGGPKTPRPGSTSMVEEPAFTEEGDAVPDVSQKKPKATPDVSQRKELANTAARIMRDNDWDRNDTAKLRQAVKMAQEEIDGKRKKKTDAENEKNARKPQGYGQEQ